MRKSLRLMGTSSTIKIFDRGGGGGHGSSDRIADLNILISFTGVTAWPRAPEEYCW